VPTTSIRRGVGVVLLGPQLEDLGEGVVGDRDHGLGAELLGDVDGRHDPSEGTGRSKPEDLQQS
jgi:hypothetical protein